MGLPRAASVLLIYLALILTLVVFGVVIIPPIYHEIELAIVNAPTYGDQISDRLREMQAQFPLLPPLDEQLLQQLRGLGSQVGQLASQALVVARFALGVFSGVLNTILVLLITLYLVVDGHRVREYFLSYFPPSQRPRLRHITGRMGARMGGWLVGQITLCVVIGSLSYVGLSLLGIRGAVLLAVIAAIGEAIPIIGPIASAVPAIIVAATQAPLLAVGVLILYLVIQQLENNLLVPKIMERAVSLHPLAVVLSLLTGGELLGVIGTIVAVPVAAAVAVILDEIRRVERAPEPAPINAPEAAA
jgi:predicted PurR-regulated permease PerM